jgi:hypoxanthine phosphoribosyltransferase
MKLPKSNVLFSEAVIRERVNELGRKINAEYNDDKQIVCVCVLRGAVMFYTDLMKAIDNENVVYDFITLQSYESAMVEGPAKTMTTTGRVRLVQDLRFNVEGKHVLVVEDIVDTGHTMQKLVADLKSRGPKAVHVCTLLLKPEKLKVKLDVEYVALEIPNDFIVGYGLDYDGYGRNLRDIYTVVE